MRHTEKKILLFIVVLLSLSNLFSQDSYINNENSIIINEINAPLAITSLNPVNITGCYGDSNGSITVDVTGGQAPYLYSIDGGANYQSSNNFTGLPYSVSGYNVYVKDNLNATNNDFVLLTQPNEIVINIGAGAKTDVTGCYGDTNGEIHFSATGGTGILKYSIDGTNFFTNNGDFVGLGSGTYQTTAKDVNSCSKSGSNITISQPTLFEISNELKENVTGCYGYSNGKIEITVTGGTPNYKYSIDNGTNWSAIGNFPGLSAGGPHTVKVKDINDCTVTGGTYTITQPTQVVASATKVNVLTCYNDDSGKITVSAIGGTGSYQYSISGYGYSPNPVFDNIVAGTYDTYAKDSNSCLANGPQLVVTQPSELIIDSQTSTNIEKCFGDDDGTITITASGGTLPLHYSIDNGTTFTGSGNFTNLPQNSYKVIIKDDKNCTKVGNDITITQPFLLSIVDASGTNVTTCANGNNGTMTITANGGTGSLDYSVDNGTTWQNDYSFSNLYAGTYTIKVKDTKDCEITYTSTITLTAPPPILIDSETPTNPTCYGGTNGTVKILAQGGSGSLYYSANDGDNYTVANFISGLSANVDNIIKVKDDQGCEVTGSTIVLSQPPDLIIDNIDVQNVTSCFTGSNGSITITASGATPSYTYSVDAGAAYQSSNSFTGLSAGIYYIRVKDSGDCVKVGATKNITQPDQLKIDIQKSKNIEGCKGESIGNIEIITSGGSLPISYSINGGSTYVKNSGLFENLPAGNYPVKIKDAQDCVTNGITEIITEPEELVITEILYTDVTCKGLNNGTIIINATGGQSPLSYSTDNGANYSSNILFSGLSAGNYTPKVKDTYGCALSDALLTIIEPDTIDLSQVLVNDIDSCYGDATGKITLIAIGGTGTLKYSIDGGSKFYENDGKFTNIIAGTYTINVKDQKDCKVYWDTVVPITQPEKIIIDSTKSSSVLCFADSDGTISVYAKGGTGTKSFSIDGGNTFLDNNGIFTEIKPSLNYKVYVKDEKSCTMEGSEVAIYEPDSLTFASIAVEDEQCIGKKNGSVTLSLYGGTQPYFYGMTDSTYSSSRIISGLAPGGYVIYVKDSNGCKQQTGILTIGSPASSAPFTNDISEGCSPLAVQFTKTAGGTTYLWDFGEGKTSIETSPLHYMINPTDTVQTYTVTSYAVSETGCEDKASTQIKVYPQAKLKITVSPDTLFYPNTTITIANNSTSTNSNYLWDFDDGETSNSENPATHTYTTCDNYTGSVIASNAWQCADTAFFDVVVEVNKPFAFFEVDETGKCTPAIITFTDKSTYSNLYSWDFGDAGTSSNQNTEHTFTVPGEYKVTHTVLGDCNTTASFDTIITVWRSPSVDFNIEPDSIMPPDQFASFFNYSDENAVDFLWEFGDGETSQLFEPTHGYENSEGDMKVTLHVTSENGCIDSLTKEKGIHIIPTGKVKFPLAFSPNGDGTNDSFSPADFKSVLKYDFIIYNRWGKIMFYTTDINEKWNGTYQGSKCVQGVYVWRMTGQYTNGKPFDRAGDITLVR